MRITVRVKPGSSRTQVGGRYGADQLVVAVQAPAVDGRANKAVLEALADALGTRPAHLEIVRGHTSRSKVVEIPEDFADLVEELLAS